MHRRLAILALALLLAAPALATSTATGKVLRIYGPGGPHHVLDECATLFSEKHGIAVQVTRALPHDLEVKLREDGDLYYGGAEYMLEEFHRRNPDILDIDTAERLHPRRIGIIVRKGNPHGIRGIDDLDRDGIHLLDVKLENMRHFYGQPDNGIANVVRFEYTGQQGVKAWQTTPELDAWVTYRSWHRVLEAETEFIEIPGEQALRYIPIALTERTPHAGEAKAFVDFLKSPEAREVFEAHGWD